MQRQEEHRIREGHNWGALVDKHNGDGVVD